jgi:hypothetical protein
MQEARALEGIGKSHLLESNPGEAATCLQQALTIYERIGALAAQRVRETLEHHRLTPVAAESSPTAASGEGYQPPPPAAPSGSQ